MAGENLVNYRLYNCIHRYKPVYRKTGKIAPNISQWRRRPSRVKVGES